MISLGNANTYQAATTAAIQAEAKKLNATVTVLNGNFSVSTQLSLCQEVGTNPQYQAAIILPDAGPEETSCPAELHSKPLVATYSPLGAKGEFTLKPLVPGVVADTGPVGGPAALLKGISDATVDACAGLNPCNIAWMRTTSTLPSSDSLISQYLMAAIAKHPNMHIVAQADTPLTPAGGQQQMQLFLQKTKDINVVTGYGTESVFGAIPALKAAGLTPGNVGKDVRIVDNGATFQGMALLKKGVIFATITELPTIEGEYALKEAVAAVRKQPVQAAVNSLAIAHLPLILDANNIKKYKSFKGQWSA